MTSLLLSGVARVALAQDDEGDKAASSEESSATKEEATPTEKPAAAEEAGASEEAAAEESEPGFLAQYGHHVSNTFLGGLNGLITWPADPVMLAIRPTDEMRAMPGGVVTGPMVGFFAGTLQGVYRLVTATLDVGLCPLSFFPMFSPEPRYQLIPGWEHEG